MPLLLPCALYVAAVTIFLTAGDVRTLDHVLGPCLVAIELAGIVLCLVAARHRGLDRRARRPWLLLAVALVFFLTSGTAFAIAARNGVASLQAFPVVAAVGCVLRLAMAGTLLAALLGFAADPLTRRDVLRIGFDVTTVVGGGAIAMWYLTVGPALGGAATGALVMTAAITVSDLVLILGSCVTLLRGVPAASRLPVGVLLAGVVASLGSNLYLSIGSVTGATSALTGWMCVGIVTPAFLFALAPAVQIRIASRPRPARASRTFRARLVTPYAGLAVGFGFLILAAAREGLFWTGLIGGTAIMVVGVVGRQVVAVREIRALAVTDHLTGMANRARLRDELDRAVQRSRRTGDPVGMLILDMDDFKQVNDTLGHEAGDALLAGFARLLQETVRVTDTPARLGGDEFAVLLDGVVSEADAMAVADRILAAAATADLSYRGEPLVPRVSIGVAVATFRGTEADGAELLHRADLAMYAEKREGTHGRRLYPPARESVGSLPGH